jgi:hypothetical protein
MDKTNDHRMDDDHQKYIPGVQEKSTLGGAFNTGVTSDDPEEKREIEKKGSLAVLKPKPEEPETDE